MLRHFEINKLRQLSYKDEAINLRQFMPVSTTYGSAHQAVVAVQGCFQRCLGCCLPELELDISHQEQLITSQDLAQAIVRTFKNTVHKHDDTHTLVLTGGEPFAQSAPLACVVQQVRLQMQNVEVVAFSGYEHGDLLEFSKENQNGNGAIASLLTQTDVLFAGPYKREHRNTNLIAGCTTKQRHQFTENGSAIDGRNYGQSTSLALGAAGSIAQHFNGFPTQS